MHFLRIVFLNFYKLKAEAQKQVLVYKKQIFNLI